MQFINIGFRIIFYVIRKIKNYIGTIKINENKIQVVHPLAQMGKRN